MEEFGSHRMTPATQRAGTGPRKHKDRARRIDLAVAAMMAHAAASTVEPAPQMFVFD